MGRQQALIGVCYDDAYAVEETFQLFKIPWEWYDPAHTYDVIIARKEEIPNSDAYIIDLSQKDYFAEIARDLNEGIPHCHEPVIEILIDELRETLKKHTVLVEIPPSPKGHSYIIALTHDVDVTSVKERRWISVGYAIYLCVRKGLIMDGLRILGAKCGIGKDPWNCFSEWMELERSLGVRSTFYFLPAKDKAGIGSPKIRACMYDLDPKLLSSLQDDGWEVGVHGIDNWIDEEAAHLELDVIATVASLSGKMPNTNITTNPIKIQAPSDPPYPPNPPETSIPLPIGNRVHWLLFNKETWKILDDAGYSYDSTFGYNEDVGFRAGTLQIYKPRNTDSLLELPLHIQDVGLFGSYCWICEGEEWIKVPCLSLSPDDARSRCDSMLDYAKKYGGVITLLWHQERLAPPNSNRELYEEMIRRGIKDNAWITTAENVVDWFALRRECIIGIERFNSSFKVSITGGKDTKSAIPCLVLRHPNGDVPLRNDDDCDNYIKIDRRA